MTGPGGTVGIRAVRSEWLAATRRDGLTRPDTALFEFPPAPDGPDRGMLRRTLLMAVFFGISLSTLRLWSADPPQSYAAWYRRHPEKLPTCVAFSLGPEWFAPARDHWRYLCLLKGSFGSTFRYAKVRESAPVPADCRLPAELPVSVHDVAEAQERVRAGGDAAGPLHDLPFYVKYQARPPHDVTPTSGGRSTVAATADGRLHPDAVLAVPMLCARLADLLLDRVPAAWSQA